MQSFDKEVLKDQLKDIVFIEEFGGVRVSNNLKRLIGKDTWTPEDISEVEKYLSSKSMSSSVNKSFVDAGMRV